MAAHFERENRQREHERDPEPPRHVRNLGIRRGFGGGQLRLQRHAADRADAGADLPDLQMHRAGVDRAFRRGRRLRRRSRVDGAMAVVVRQDKSRRRIAVAEQPPVCVKPLARAMSRSSGVATYTLWGYIARMRKDIKASCAKRLSRIEGQVRGIARMVDEDRYCIDIVTQVAAVRAALRRVEEEILRDHVAHCVEHAIASGNKADQRRKIEELMNVVGRAER